MAEQQRSEGANLKELYDRDFPLWVEINLQLLKEKKYNQVDWENLLEEIEDLGFQYVEVGIKQVAIILASKYKLNNFAHMVNEKECKNDIEDAKDDLYVLFYHYPSTINRVKEKMDMAWLEAVVMLRKWLRENDINPDSIMLPEQCPYSWEQIMDQSFNEQPSVEQPER